MSASGVERAAALASALKNMDFAEVDDLRGAGQLSGEAAAAALPEEDKVFLDNLVRRMSSTRAKAKLSVHRHE